MKIKNIFILLFKEILHKEYSDLLHFNKHYSTNTFRNFHSMVEMFQLLQINIKRHKKILLLGLRQDFNSQLKGSRVTKQIINLLLNPGPYIIQVNIKSVFSVQSIRNINPFHLMPEVCPRKWRKFTLIMLWLTFILSKDNKLSL